jgi:hypothetical protein
MDLLELLALDDSLENRTGSVDVPAHARLLDQVRTALRKIPVLPPFVPGGAEPALFRPRDGAQWGRLLSQWVAHLPWSTPTEARWLLERPEGRPWREGAVVLCSGAAIRGVALVGPVYGKLALNAFALEPALRDPAAARPWVEKSWQVLAADLPLRWAVYDEPYREAFAQAGFVTAMSRNRIVIPLVERPPPEGYPVHPMRRAGLSAFLAATHTGVDCSVDEMLEEASFGVDIEGRLAGAVIVSRGPLSDWATLEQVWMDPKLRARGLATAVCQTSMNELVRLGVRHYVAWELTTNRTVRPLNDHFGVSRADPVRHYGHRPPARAGPALG